MTPADQDDAVLAVLIAEPAPGNDRIAQIAGMSVPTVKRVISRLVAAGKVEVVDSSRGRGRHTEFLVVLDAVEEVDQEVDQSGSEVDHGGDSASRARAFLALDLTQGQELPPNPPEDNFAEEARAISAFVFAERFPRPMKHPDEVRDIAQRCLEAGHRAHSVRQAMLDVKVITVPSVEFWMNENPVLDEPKRERVPLGNVACVKCEGRGQTFDHDGFVRDCLCIDPALRKRRARQLREDQARLDRTVKAWDESIEARA